MVAVPEACVSAPMAVDADRSAGPVHRRRVVAIAVSPMELLRPASDLARLVESFDRVDLLLATEDAPAVAPGSVGVLSTLEGDSVQLVNEDWEAEDWEAEDWEAEDWEAEDEPDDIREGVSRLGHPDLHLHRLGLRQPLDAGAEGDLIAAISELVGFDPEPGTYCLAPATAPSDPGRAVINRAVQRIAQVYGLPLLRYRCLELSVVGEDAT